VPFQSIFARSTISCSQFSLVDLSVCVGPGIFDGRLTYSVGGAPLISIVDLLSTECFETPSVKYKCYAPDLEHVPRRSSVLIVPCRGHTESCAISALPRLSYPRCALPLSTASDRRILNIGPCISHPVSRCLTVNRQRGFFGPQN
jgi:hypothetical protein